MVEGWRRDRVTMLKAGGVEAERTGDQNRGPEIKTEDRRCLRRDRERRSGLARFRNFRSAKVEQVR